MGCWSHSLTDYDTIRLMVMRAEFIPQKSWCCCTFIFSLFSPASCYLPNRVCTFPNLADFTGLQHTRLKMIVLVSKCLCLHSQTNSVSACKPLGCCMLLTYLVSVLTYLATGFTKYLCLISSMALKSLWIFYFVLAFLSPAYLLDWSVYLFPFIWSVFWNITYNQNGTNRGALLISLNTMPPPLFNQGCFVTIQLSSIMIIQNHW